MRPDEDGLTKNTVLKTIEYLKYYTVILEEIKISGCDFILNNIKNLFFGKHLDGVRSILALFLPHGLS